MDKTLSIRTGGASRPFYYVDSALSHEKPSQHVEPRHLGDATNYFYLKKAKNFKDRPRPAHILRF